MNIYELKTQGEKEWIVANTAIEALQIYNCITDLRISEMGPSDDLVMLTDEQAKSIIINYEDEHVTLGKQSSLYDLAKLSIEPQYLASTFYF